MTKHAVALSGGKDSTAVACRLRELNPDVSYIYPFTPTGNELPDMVAHWAGLARYLDAPILPLSTGKSLRGLIEQWNALPNNRQRWCTRMLKFEPYYAWLAQQGPIVSYVGLRADEERRGGFEFPEIDNITVSFPLKDWGWGLDDVWSYLDSIPGHTSKTMAADIPTRTDCAWCYHQRLGEWWNLWKFHLPIYLEAEQLEEATGHTFRNESRDSWPASLKELRQRFEAGQVPRGADNQLALFDMRPSMCRTCSL